MKYFLLILAAWINFSPVHAEVTVELGSVERVSNLFSYPNNCHVVCFNDQTLEETIDHYLTSSLHRDGYSQEIVNVSISNGNVFAEISGNVPVEYSKAIKELLKAGDIALKGALQINKDKKWLSDWRFFLPLGVAMHNHKSVQLLHFPPDYVLEDVQDYLDANTTKRWASLLTANGVPTTETDLYQTIIDIAPIAAPSRAGRKLDKTYPYFSSFSKSLIEAWTAPHSGSIRSRPMIVYGWPARKWLYGEYGIDLDVLKTAEVQVSGGRTVAVLGTNHPSYIWYAADPRNCDESKEEAYRRGIKVMTEDLTAACWQAKMADGSNRDRVNTLNECKSSWEAQPKEVCKLFHMQVRRMKESNAIQACNSIVGSSFSALSDADARVLELKAPIEMLSRDPFSPLFGKMSD